MGVRVEIGSPRDRPRDSLRRGCAIEIHGDDLRSMDHLREALREAGYPEASLHPLEGGMARFRIETGPLDADAVLCAEVRDIVAGVLAAWDVAPHDFPMEVVGSPTVTRIFVPLWAHDTGRLIPYDDAVW